MMWPKSRRRAGTPDANAVHWREPNDSPNPRRHAECTTLQCLFLQHHKSFANQNVCFTCGFNSIEDWHTSATCPRKKQGPQDRFTCSNYMEYECANHQFCYKVLHKTMYPTM
jgi:hypothetical protein